MKMTRLSALLAMAMGPLLQLTLEARAERWGGAATSRRTRRAPGKGRKGYLVDGKRVFSRPAAPFIANKKGFRWADGEMVARVA